MCYIISLPFNTQEEQVKCFKACQWLEKRLGDPVHMTDIHRNDPYHTPWRDMRPGDRGRVFDYLITNGGWLTCGDMDYRFKNRFHMHQFLISDPDVAMLFKLAWL